MQPNNFIKQLEIGKCQYKLTPKELIVTNKRGKREKQSFHLSVLDPGYELIKTTNWGALILACIYIIGIIGGLTLDFLGNTAFHVDSMIRLTWFVAMIGLLLYLFLQGRARTVVLYHSDHPVIALQFRHFNKRTQEVDDFLVDLQKGIYVAQPELTGIVDLYYHYGILNANEANKLDIKIVEQQNDDKKISGTVVNLQEVAYDNSI